MTGELKNKYFVQFDYCEISMSPRIQITKKQYNEIKEHYESVVQNANAQNVLGNTGTAYKGETQEQDCGNCVIIRDWYSVDTSTVFLWRYKCKDGYKFTTRR